MDFRNSDENGRYNTTHMPEGDDTGAVLSKEDKLAILNKMRIGNGPAPIEGFLVNPTFKQNTSPKADGIMSGTSIPNDKSPDSGNQAQRSADQNGLMAQKSIPEMDETIQPNFGGPGKAFSRLKHNFKKYK